MPGHGVRLAGDGRLVLARTAPPEDPERLRRTIDRLRAAAGAGGVEIVDASTDDDTVELVLAFAGHAPAGPIRADELAPIAAALAAHLSDLHLRRVVHGAVVAEHVLVDATGSVRLCGFGNGADASPGDDVHALGTLIVQLLDPDDRGVTADALRFHADRCRVDEAAMRPTMAAIAASLASVAAGGRAIAAPARVERSRPRWPIGVGAALVLATAVVVLALPRRAGSQSPEQATPVTTTAPRSTTTVRLEPTRVWPTTLDGDGARWTLGDADDRPLLGDWDCDGVPTPALLQRPGGAVWVIDMWPDGDAVPARYVTTISGAVDASVERTAGCDALVVRSDRGEIRPALSA